MAQDAATQAVRQAMTEAAAAISASVRSDGGYVGRMFGVDRAGLLLQPMDSAERDNWQFWPASRIGLPLEYMLAAEREATHELLSAALSSRGYLKAVHIMQLEQILEMLDERGFPRSVDHYVLALFGEPSATESWGWRFEGHHVSLSFLVTPEGVAVTPSFFGSNPGQVLSGPLTGFRVHGEIEDLARELVGSFSPAQRAEGIVSEQAPSEIATANINKPRTEWEVWRTTVEPVGIEVARLNEMQRFWVGLIVDEVIGNYDSALQQRYRERLDQGSLKFAWMGGTEKGEPHYFRLQGADFLFEYDNVQNGANHVHSVWRSKDSDFGADLLARHYAEEH